MRSTEQDSKEQAEGLRRLGNSLLSLADLVESGEYRLGEGGITLTREVEPGPDWGSGLGVITYSAGTDKYLVTADLEIVPV